MLLQTNSYIVPKEKRAEHSRLIRRFRQTLLRLGCDHFEVYEQVGSNWSNSESAGRYVQILRFLDRKHQLAVQAAERSDPTAQAVIADFCELINFPYQQQQGLFAVGFYTSVLPVQPKRGARGELVSTVEHEVVDDPEAEMPYAGASDGPRAEDGLVEDAGVEHTIANEAEVVDAGFEESVLDEGEEHEEATVESESADAVPHSSPMAMPTREKPDVADAVANFIDAETMPEVAVSEGNHDGLGEGPDDGFGELPSDTYGKIEPAVEAAPDAEPYEMDPEATAETGDLSPVEVQAESDTVLAHEPEAELDPIEEEEEPLGFILEEEADPLDESPAPAVAHGHHPVEHEVEAVEELAEPEAEIEPMEELDEEPMEELVEELVIEEEPLEARPNVGDSHVGVSRTESEDDFMSLMTGEITDEDEAIAHGFIESELVDEHTNGRPNRP